VTFAALPLVPGLNPADWTPRKLRHSVVSLLSDTGVPLGDIAELVGHSGTTVTELVYRHQLRPVIQTGDRHGSPVRPWHRVGVVRQ
jgi:integrase